MIDLTANDAKPLRPSRKKPFFPVKEELNDYLIKHGRAINLPCGYNDLFRFNYAVPLRDKAGNDTYWETVSYDSREWDYLRESLVRIYAALKTEGDLSFTEQLDVARIDFCGFGNSQPFRIRIVNKFNDNYDHYYIKPIDASRVYGLELEHLLSPNRITFLANKDTLVEEHIPGIPGDVFIEQHMHKPDANPIRLAKEFVKFNERCFVRLLGDMRAYNFIVNITPDIEDVQYRIRAIDFDQQSYEGRRNLYLPQFFKENFPFVQTAQKYLNKSSIAQYQAEERTLIAFRIKSSRARIKELLDILRDDIIAPDHKVKQLSEELAEYFNQPTFLRCTTMGQLIESQLKQTLRKSQLLTSQGIY
ncbi:hypothetical protein [Filimonas effusa]|uniref:hypothetical protein n=1 Tax=Filimonas effusa TaxID=2508721 RepID=UPI001FE7A12A|nr:hypothetical protein [Filimonas effusa]